MVLPPAAAVRVPPVQVVDALGVEATTTPDGRLSVKSSPVADAVLPALSMVNSSVLIPSMTMGFAEKLLLNGGIGSTVNVSFAVPLLPRDDVKSPVVFAYVPSALLVMSTETVQPAPADTVPPV